LSQIIKRKKKEGRKEGRKEDMKERRKKKIVIILCPSLICILPWPLQDWT